MLRFPALNNQSLAPQHLDAAVELFPAIAEDFSLLRPSATAGATTFDSFRLDAGQSPASTPLTGRRDDNDCPIAVRLVLPLPRHAGPFGSHHPIPGSRSHTSHVRRG